MTANLPICRTCLERITEKEYPLTGELVFNVDLNVASMLEFCLSSKLELRDDLPDSVCVSCFKTIRIAYTFLKHVKESEKKLGEKPHVVKYEVTNTDSADADESLICHDYAEQDSTKYPASENESEDDNCGREQDSDGNSRDDVADIHRIAQECGNGTIEIETIDERIQKKSKAPYVSYDCPLCDKKFKQTHFFHVHVAGHGASSVSCTKCDVQPVFDLPGYFNHYKEYHRYQCEFCDKSLVTKSGYDYHTSLHTSTVRYKCTVKSCRRSYVTMEQLKQHIKSHTITKIYPCNLCDATFNHKDNLNYHLKQHAGKRDHLCSMCGRAFFQAGALQIHMMRHTKTKRFCCEMCGKAFLTGVSLRKHINICKKKREKSEAKDSLE